MQAAPTAERPLVVVGAGGHAVSIGGIIQALGCTVALCVDRAKAGGTFLGAPIVADLAEGFEPSRCALVIAIGDNAVRQTIASEIATRYLSARFATLVHPAASVAANSTIGDGTVVMPCVVVGPATHIGRFVILNTRASVDHDCRIADFASLAPGAVTGGNVRVGSHAAISIGASIRHGVSIGCDVVIGGGSYVHHDVPDGVVAFGVPARTIRARKRGDRYL